MNEGFFLVVWGLNGLTEGGGPSALRWMAARAEFPCGLTGGCVASALRWMPVRCVDGCGVLEVSDVCVASARCWMPVRCARYVVCWR